MTKANRLVPLLAAVLAVTVVTGPVMAAPEAAIVLQYKLTDGTLKPLLFTAPEGLSLADCRSQIRDVLPTFKRQVEQMAIPEFSGAEFVDAKCERYSEDLLK
ncbi:hypothetical protein N8A98_11535 [Devosia neptuniae]|uniref:UrcA family protein n=1 Tax=Devosia neptuniae TaxID=191302 RepID=A0ABY6CHQ2_9HYPH|nr:hypothetical protein [Devosia neptuniae]UXN71761.1 hypothetical protein N8A98_11535 [Devosia neptuniae]